MDQAYCPYCGKEITVRGQTHCPHCGADIIDIWKLINSGLQPPPLVKPAPSHPHTLDWIGPAIVISLGLALFALAAYLAIPWLTEKIIPGRTGEFVPPLGAGSNEPLPLLLETPTALALLPSPTAAPEPTAVPAFLAHGQVIYLKCLGDMDGNRWLSADPAASSVYLAASQQSASCCCCWQVINPENDNTIQLTLVTADGLSPYLTANTETEQIWLTPPGPASLAQTWEVVQHANGSISLLNQGEGPERYLDGLTVQGKVALAPVPDTNFSGAYWEVQLVSPEALEMLSEVKPETDATSVASDPCQSGSRLSIGMEAAVIEGGGRNRLRKSPSLSAKIIELIPEGDPVKILDGPECSSGIIWWRVKVLETGSTGWTAEVQDGAYYLRPLD